jgi:septal ring factor EnvC (AmiA/AmiB activator)
MTDEAPTPQGRQQADQAMRQRLLITLAAAVVLIGGGWLTLWATGGSSTVAPSPHPTAVSAASRRSSDELLETTKGLQVTQQQAVDQLQVVQDQLVAQRAEMKKLSEQITALTERLDVLQQSITNMPATTRSAGSPSGPQPKAH